MSFEWYFAALEGKNPAVHEGDPQPGYYRTRPAKGAAWVPVWIAEDLSAYQGFNGAETAIDAADRWAFICRNPVPYEVWLEVYQGRATWPDDIAPAIAAAEADHAAFTGSNAPADEREAMSDEIESALAAAREWLKGVGDPKTWGQSDRDKCQNFRDRISKLSGDAEARRTSLKEPILNAGREIDGAWDPLVTKAKDAADQLRDRLGAALKAERDRQAAAAVEAARIADEARRAEGGATSDQPEPPTQAEPPKVLAGTNGRRTGLKARKVYRLTDATALLSYLIGMSEIPRDLIDAAEKIGRKIAMNGVNVPGISVETEETAS